MSKAPKIFVHVGPSKTGTTALQKALSYGAPSTLHYPEAGKWNDSGHHSLCFSLAGYQTFFKRDLAPKETVAAFQAEMQGADRPVLISSETITDLTFDHDGYHETLNAFFRECGEDLEYIYTLRHPLSRAASLYKFLMCHADTGLTLDPLAFLKSKIDHLLLDTYLSRMDELKIRFRTIAYEPSRDFVPRFMEMIGHPLDHYDDVRVNASSSDAILPIMLCVNRMFEDHAVRRQIQRKFRLNMEGIDETAAAWPFDPEAVAWLLDKVETDRTALAKRGIEYPALQKRDHYRMTQNTQDRLKQFLRKQAKVHETALRPDVTPDDVIADVIGMFR